jgi:hypothetical protein
MSFGNLEGMIEDPQSIEDLEDAHQRMHLDSIFNGMKALDLMNIITSDPDCQCKCVEDLMQEAEQSARDYADNLYKQLEREWDYLNSDSCMAEHFECNDIYFDEEGEIYE